MKCPNKNCKGIIKKDISYTGNIFNRRKKVIYSCPFCDFKKIKQFKINKIEYEKKTGEQ